MRKFSVLLSAFLMSAVTLIIPAYASLGMNLVNNSDMESGDDGNWTFLSPNEIVDFNGNMVLNASDGGGGTIQSSYFQIFNGTNYQIQYDYLPVNKTGDMFGSPCASAVDGNYIQQEIRTDTYGGTVTVFFNETFVVATESLPAPCTNSTAVRTANLTKVDLGNGVSRIVYNISYNGTDNRASFVFYDGENQFNGGDTSYFYLDNVTIQEIIEDAPAEPESSPATGLVTGASGIVVSAIALMIAIGGLVGAFLFATRGKPDTNTIAIAVVVAIISIIFAGAVASLV